MLIIIPQFPFISYKVDEKIAVIKALDNGQNQVDVRIAAHSFITAVLGRSR